MSHTAESLQDKYIHQFGTDPFTGVIKHYIYGQPSEGRKNIMMWNKLTKSWYYSQDAGLTWEENDKSLKELNEMSDIMRN